MTSLLEDHEAATILIAEVVDDLLEERGAVSLTCVWDELVADGFADPVDLRRWKQRIHVHLGRRDESRELYSRYERRSGQNTRRFYRRRRAA
jgi:hypothetical protein